MVLKRYGSDHDLAVFVGNNASGRRQIRRADSHMGIGKAFDVAKRCILRSKIIDGLLGRQVFMILRGAAFLPR